MNFIQQGDVLIKRVDSIPTGANKVGRNHGKYGRGRYILAEGETTGHAHAITQEVELFEKDGILYMKNNDQVEVEHEEHGNVQVPDGIWRVDIVQEYDHFEEEARRVMD